MGRAPKPFLEGLRPTLHISHRGGSALAPENTLPAFERAARLHRTDVLELDLQPTRDGELVVAHDPTLDRCTDGSGPIADLTLAQVKALDFGYRFTPDGGRTFPFRGQGIRVLTFAELLAAFPTLRLNVELKSAPPGTEDVFARVLRKAGAVNRICCGSELDEIAARLHRALPEGCHFYPRDALGGFVLSLRGGDPVPDDPRFTVLDMPLEWGGVRLIDDALIATAREMGRWINVWTVDDPEEMRRLVREGIGGIMTDRPDLLRTVLDGQ